MKVLQVVADGAPGGGTNHVLQLVRGLKGIGELILLTQRNSYLKAEAEKYGIQVISGDFFRSRTDSAAMRLVRDTIRQHRPDVVHCHGGRAAFFRSFSMDDTPSVYTVHGFHFAKKRWLTRIAGWLGEFRSIRRMQKIIFVSDFDRSLAVSSKLLPAGKSFRVIHNGISVPETQPSSSTEKLGVGFVGRMVYQKNPQLFVKVLERLPNVKAVMVGGGELETEVAQMIESRGLSHRVKLCGRLGHEDTLRVLSELDVLLMTPRWEGLPLLPLEAMLLRVPVVSTCCGGIPEIIDHGRTGMLAKSESAEELATHVATLLRNESVRKQIIAEAAKRVEQQFGEETMLQSVRETYESISRVRTLSTASSL